MRLPVLLAFVAIWMSAVDAGSVCPDDPVSSSTPSSDCDLCEELFDKSSDFVDKCGQFLLADDMDYYRYQCEYYKDDDKEFQYFMEDLREHCVDNHHCIFEFPICGCNPCVKLQRLSGDFITKCVLDMPIVLVNHLIYTCYDVIDDTERLWELWNKIDDICYYITNERIKLPMCRCDVCWMLMEWDSDFMQNCGQFMSAEHLECIVYECEQVKCDAAKLWDFQKWLNDECTHYGYSEFELDTCDCNECWLLFDEESDFMKKCGSHITETQINKLIDDCFSVQKDMVALWVLFDDLEQYCYYNYYTYFKIPMCECEPCWLLKDPSTEFHQKCFSQLDQTTQHKIIEYCLEVWDDADAYSTYLDYIDYICDAYYSPVDVPSCFDCSCSPVDIIFLVDSSGSINDAEWIDVIRFVSDAIDQLVIGEDCTHVGLINFNHCQTLVLDLVSGDDRNTVDDAVGGLVNEGGHTNIECALQKMLDEFDLNGRPGALKVGVLLSDGETACKQYGEMCTKLCGGCPLPLPPLNDVDKMVAVAIGVQDLDYLMTIASGPGMDNVLTADQAGLLPDILPRLLELICASSG